MEMQGQAAQTQGQSQMGGGRMIGMMQQQSPMGPNPNGPQAQGGVMIGHPGTSGQPPHAHGHGPHPHPHHPHLPGPQPQAQAHPEQPKIDSISRAKSLMPSMKETISVSV